MRRLLTMFAATALLVSGVGATSAQADGPSDGATVAEATDPAGDADGRTARARAAADLRKVTYFAPSTPDGPMKFRFKFQNLQNGRKANTPNQQAIAVLATRGTQPKVWWVRANNRTGEVLVQRRFETKAEEISPTTVQLNRTFKRGGVIAVTVSTEWLSAKRVDVFGFGASGQAVDRVPRFWMDVSGDDVAPAVPARETATPVAYADCAAMNAVWRNGVARSGLAARMQVREGSPRPAASKRARAVYREHKMTLDPDRDGTACER